MKRFPFILLSLFISIALVFFGALWWWSSNSNAPSTLSDKVRIVIPRGKSAEAVGALLYEEGLIKNPLAFKIYVQITGNADKLQAGEFEIAKNLKLPQLVEALFSPPLELWITIPEGLRREEIPERIVKSLEMDTKTADIFTLQFLELTKDKEGFLFPSTYLFPRTVNAQQVIEKLNNTFDTQYAQFHTALVDGKTAGGLNNLEIVTLASIIERETKTNEERPVVAGIYLNRINLGMPLQADATVQYDVANRECSGRRNCSGKDWWPILTRYDIDMKSPYSTYANLGLPPAPIANPGISSIKAVIFPEKSDYLYYIHDPEGVIHYAKTLAEHNANVSKYLGK